ncbi:MAG: hypothetical protein VZQ83_07965 [Eubacterium sp.]|nr:hypothetical protein [Eubacterium sp.]
MNRKSDIIFYDVTNFYYETEDPDDDIVDEEGNIIEKGIRKMGVSKENRKQPIVQMGLFMDNSGIPIAIESFPGNTPSLCPHQRSHRRSSDDLFYRIGRSEDHLQVANSGHTILRWYCQGFFTEKSTFF